MFLNLKEALNIPDATCIGTGIDCDLYKISSWEAANSFVLSNDEEASAGEYFFNNRSTFDRYIMNGSNKAYYFVYHDTNECLSAVIMDGSANGKSVVIYDENDDETTKLNISFNGEYESVNNHSNEVHGIEGDASLFLLPNSVFKFKGQTVDTGNGFIYSGDTLYAVSSCFTSNLHQQISKSQLKRLGISKIKPDAFNYGVRVEYTDNEEPAAETEVPAANASKYKDYLSYKVMKNQVIILGLRKDVEEIIIPNEIDGKPVTEIADYAFAYSDIKKITQEDPQNSQINKLGRYCFAYITGLPERYWITVRPTCIIPNNVAYKSKDTIRINTTNDIVWH